MLHQLSTSWGEETTLAKRSSNSSAKGTREPLGTRLSTWARIELDAFGERFHDITEATSFCTLLKAGSGDRVTGSLFDIRSGALGYVQVLQLLGETCMSV